MSDYDVGENSWLVWSKHVLMQLEFNAKCLSDIKKEQIAIGKEITALKVKSGIWGAVGGAIPVCVMIGLYLLK